MHNMTFEQIRNNLKLTLDIVENCGDAYRNASDTIKRLMNQAIFEKFYIISNDEVELDIEFSFGHLLTNFWSRLRTTLPKSIRTNLQTESAMP